MTAAGGPLPRWMLPATVPLSWAYGLGACLHAALDARTKPFDPGVRVVSVGNVTAGGTGKTPFVRWCAAQLLAAGRRPAIALRGYRAVDGRSDEAEEYRSLLPGVPLAVGADRARAIDAMRAAHADVDCVLLDDGFQHRRLARALDIVLVDATRPGLGGRVLPAGWLREPASALRRAGMVVVTRAHEADEPALAALVEAFHGRPPVAWTATEWTGLRVVRDGVERQEPVEWLRGRAVTACAAIGNPGQFLAQCRSAGARLDRTEVLPDHAPFDAARVRGLAAAAGAGGTVLLTGKDWAKAAAHAHGIAGPEWAIPSIGLRFLGSAAGELALRRALVGPSA